MRQLVLFGIGSSLIVEYIETCARLGIEIAAGVRNHAGESFLDADLRTVDAAGVDRALLDVVCFCPLFTPAHRFAATTQALSLGFVFDDALVDPTSVIARSTTIAEGTYVNAACVIGARTAIGSHAIVNRGCAIGHHANVREFASIGPGVVAGAYVDVGVGASIGAGAVLLPKVRVGAHAIVGAGAVVTRDVPERTLVAGNPAKAVRASLEGFDAG